jgi:choline dehydrogenase-like flavoprotein
MSYDIIIVGAGLSGCALAYALSDTSQRILILEKGTSKADWNKLYAANYAERFLPQKGFTGTTKIRRELYSAAGRATLKVDSWIPVMGGGCGGGSAVYGAVLLRYKPFDFNRWPFTYDLLKPYYELAENLFQPYGNVDPLNIQKQFLLPPKPLSSQGLEVHDFFVQKGLHPFRTPIAYSASDNCLSCFGSYCATDCKKTGQNVFLDPALKKGNIEIVYSTSVESLITEGQKIVGVKVQSKNGKKEYRGKYFFLTAGAIATPMVLLNSKNSHFPHGIGNSFDLVGRNLMRHLIDFYYIKTPTSYKAHGHLNELSASDFYTENEKRWGVLSMVPGLMPPDLMAREFCERISVQLHLPFSEFWLLPIVKRIIMKLTKDRIVVTAINEDEPLRENRIMPNSKIDDVKIHYKISKNDHRKIKESRIFLKKFFKPLSVNLLKVAEDKSFLAHVCGTCKMSTNPETGVVDPKGKVFGTDNLYIADSSIFASSSGVNPSLTIAACALKIGLEFKIKESCSTTFVGL